MPMLYPDVNRDTEEVLAENGCEVYAPVDLACCGSLHGHSGDVEAARGLARRVIDAFERRELDAVISNAAGCGSFMKTYGHLLASYPEYADRAEAFVSKVRDVSEFLVEIGFKAPTNPRFIGVNSGKLTAGRAPVRVTYHEACHLVHGQGISAEPRAILDAIPGIEMVELREATWCCGSAGIYNLTHTNDSMALLERKMGHIRDTGAEVVVTGNPGCLLQIAYGAKRQGVKIAVKHPVTLLREAYEAYNAGSD